MNSRLRYRRINMFKTEHGEAGMAVILTFPHVRASTGSGGNFRPKRAGSTSLPIRRIASENSRYVSGGKRLRDFQLLTADAPTPAIEAAAAGPPNSLSTSSIVESMTDLSSRDVNLSSLHGLAIEIGRADGTILPMPLASKTLHKRLKMTADALNVSAADICRATGIAPNRWSQYINPHYKRPITLEVASKLCDAYGLTLDWIYRADPSGLPKQLHDKLAAIAVVA